ncbi:MAG: hypothetical protein K2X11_03775 [Acetobacteraceae bacterium]|nr:hypothetical protein [Acetobacteraceae bacterium]
MTPRALTLRPLTLRLSCAVLALGLLAACGRIGPPRPPGPPDQVTWPRVYPAPDRR